jgi:hypothetical protein
MLRENSVTLFHQLGILAQISIFKCFSTFNLHRFIDLLFMNSSDLNVVEDLEAIL